MEVLGKENFEKKRIFPKEKVSLGYFGREKKTGL